MTRFLVLALLLCSNAAFAALTGVSGASKSGNPPAGCTLSASIGVGQVVVAFTQGGTLPGTATVSDNVNSGDYSILQSFPAENMVIYWKITNAAGTPTVTVTNPGGFSYIWCMGITGFSGTPTSDAAIQNTASGTSTTPTISAINNFNNEVMLVGVGISYTQSVTVSGWSAAVSTDKGNGFYSIEASSGTANNFNGSWGTSQAWFIQLAGIYDAGGSAKQSGQFFLSQAQLPLHDRRKPGKLMRQAELLFNSRSRFRAEPLTPRRL